MNDLDEEFHTEEVCDHQRFLPAAYQPHYFKHSGADGHHSSESLTVEDQLQIILGTLASAPHYNSKLKTNLVSRQ
jgi:hypothetical protein